MHRKCLVLNVRLSYLCFGEVALGSVSESKRDLHPGASITWYER